MKNKVYILNLILLVFLAIFFYWFLSNDIFLGDDIASIINSVSDTAKYNIDGFFPECITKIICINMPLLFNIHPHQFSMTFGAVIRALDIALLCGLVSLFIGIEKKYYLLSATIFSAYYFCYASSNLSFAFKNLFNLPKFEAEGSFVLMTEYSHHFGQILSLILGIFFLLILANCFINEKFTEKKCVIPCCILAFLSASSSMFVSVVIGTVCALITLYYLILIFVVNKNSFIDFLKSDKTIFLPVLFFFFGMMFFAYYPNYYCFLGDNSVLHSVKTVIKALLDTVPLEIATIFILGTALYFMALYKTTAVKRTIYLCFVVLTGIFAYLYMFSGEGKNLTVMLADTFVLIRMTLLAVIFLLLGVCARELESEPKVRKIVITGFLVLYGLFSLVQFPFVLTTMALWRTINQESKITLYCIEKMYRFYSLTDRTAILPDDSLLRIMKINSFINDAAVSAEEITPDTVFKFTDFTTGYYETFYKNPKIVAYRFVPVNYAIWLFHAAGGVFTKDEIKNPDFQKLYDDSFVLNNALKK